MSNRIINLKAKIDSDADELVAHVRERARNLFQTRQMLCAEAVVVALNHGLNGGLTDAQALAMSAPFCTALGKSGCLCGALSGAVMVSGLILGKDRPYYKRKDLRNSARQLHDAFKASRGSTCCRMLTKKVMYDKKAHFRMCTGLTTEATELAARLILLKRPEIMHRVNNRFLAKRQSNIGGTILRLFHIFLH